MLIHGSFVTLTPCCGPGPHAHGTGVKMVVLLLNGRLVHVLDDDWSLWVTKIRLGLWWLS